MTDCTHCGHCREHSSWYDRKRERINATIKKVVQQSGGFSDAVLLDTCKTVLRRRWGERSISFGENGIYDPLKMRELWPPPIRSAAQATQSREEFMSRCNWKEVLICMLEEDYVQSIKRSVVWCGEDENPVKDDFFQEEMEARVDRFLQPLLDTLVNTVSALELSTEQRGIK